MIQKSLNRQFDQGRLELLLSALEMDDDIGVNGQGGFRNPAGSVGVVGAGENRLAAESPDRFVDPPVIGGDEDPNEGCDSLSQLIDVLDERLPGLISEYLSGEASGIESGGNDGGNVGPRRGLSQGIVSITPHFRCRQYP